MKRQIFAAALTLFLVAAGPADVQPASTFVKRAEAYLAKVAWMNMPKAQQAKVMADAKQADADVSGYLSKNETPTEIAKAMFEGRIVAGMPESALEIIVLPYRGHPTETEHVKEFTCITRSPGDEDQYAVRLQDGRVTAVSRITK